MILQIVIVALIPIYFLSLGTGCVERILFNRYLRRNHPEVAEVHCPGLLKGSIHQQLKTLAWLWKRQYVDLGDTGLIQRADVHRRINFVTFGLMLISMIGLLIGGQRVFSGDQKETQKTEAAPEQPATLPLSE